MGQFIEPSHLAPFATIDATKAAEMIADAEAMAVLAAPCIAALPTVPEGETAEALAIRTAKLAAVRAILRGAILRWEEAGSGALQSQQVGPFGQTFDTRQRRRAMFWPSEIDQLQAVCASGEPDSAFAIDTAPGVTSIHADSCSLNFGATYCSCGADLAGFPLFGE